MLQAANQTQELHRATAAEVADGVTASYIERVATGDVEAFTELHTRYSKKTYSICLRILRTPEDAEETNQEVWMRIWTRVETFDANVQGSAEGWIGRIARNRALDVYRRKVRNPEQQEDGEDGVPLAQIARSDSHRAIQDQIEISEVIRIAQQVLIKRDFRVFYCATVLGMSYAEIVQITQLPEGSVKSILNRARSEIRAVCSGRDRTGLVSLLAANNSAVVAQRAYDEEAGIELPELTRGTWLEAIEGAAVDEEDEFEL